MKRTLAFFLALLMALSLCACGGEDDIAGPSEEPTLSLGDMVSTDICDFTLEDCQFTHYVYGDSNYAGHVIVIDSNYLTPTDYPYNAYAAKVGHCLVSMTFTIKNKDRAGSFSIGGWAWTDWRLDWVVSYNGEDYSVENYYGHETHLNTDLNFRNAAVIHADGTVSPHGNEQSNLSAGNTITLRTFGIIDVDPENLTDGFNFTVNVLNSKGEYEYFTYTVPAQQ